MTVPSPLDVTSVRPFLARFGYLANPAPSAPELAELLRRFQTFYRLPVTGAADEQTLHAMARQRCAMPDPGGDVAFATQCGWDRTTLAYSFDTGTADLSGRSERDAVRRAIATWTSVTPVAFREVALSNS
ncbi:MAG TPA: peptidoglycan-binding protein [Pseudonocardiaceae bacterium]|jgi:matrix metalloproteinase-14 (membrane-inserted)